MPIERAGASLSKERRFELNVIEIPIDELREAPWNPNEMTNRW